MRERQRQGMSVSDLATIYGCCGLFDLCGDADLMSLSLEGQSKFLDWLGWELTNLCIIEKNFIHWVRPDQDDGECTDGFLANPCYDPNSVEFGTCGFRLEDFGRLRRKGPVRDVTYNGVRLCERQPRYRLDGSLITDDREFDLRLITEVMLQDLKRLIISGNAATGGQFDGLNQLVKTGYTDPYGRRCTSMDSQIIDWNSNGMAGGDGITWNGVAISDDFTFIDVLLSVFRHIRQNIGYAPALAAQGWQTGNMVIVAPTFLLRCILDMYTCWSVCAFTDFAMALPFLNTLEGRKFRDSLNGGMFGDGRIYLDGVEIPLIAYDWGLIQGPSRGDVYLLTGSVGNVKTLQGQLLDMKTVDYSEAGYSYTDGGRMLTWVDRDHTCVEQVAEMRPRLLAWAPWAQARFEDVVCNMPGLPKSPDPCATSFFPEKSFSVAHCNPGEEEEAPVEEQ